ncbi:MAG: hypothetical protein AB1627_01220 [Chloroflexota bacterium]
MVPDKGSVIEIMPAALGGRLYMVVVVGATQRAYGDVIRISPGGAWLAERNHGMTLQELEEVPPRAPR